MNKSFKTYFKEAKDTKEKLYLLALNSYLKTGAHHTNFQTLANELEISQAAIYKHFKNKEDLLVQSIKYAADIGKEIIDSKEEINDPAIKKLQNYLKTNLEFCTEHQPFAVALITLHYFAACIPEVKKLHEEINARRIAKIESFLNEASHEKSISISNLSDSSELIHSLLMGEMIKTFLWPDIENINARFKKLNTGVLLLINFKS